MKYAALLTTVSAISLVPGIAASAGLPEPPCNRHQPDGGWQWARRDFAHLGDRLGRKWGQQVVTLNRQGAAGLVAAQAAAAAQADGYTLYLPTSTALVILPEVNRTMTVDFARDFVALGLVGETPMAIAVSAKLGMNTLAQLISAAKAKPGDMLYAANNRGSVPHLVGAYLSRQAGISLTFVP